MKRIIFVVIIFGILLVLFIPKVSNKYVVFKQKQSDEKFERSIDKEEMELIFQSFFEKWVSGPLTVNANIDLEKRPLYIIESQYIDKSYKLKHEYRQIVIVTQADYDDLSRKFKDIVGYVKINDIEFTGSILGGERKSLNRPRKNSVTIFYSEQFYVGDGQRGSITFTKENGQWINHGGFSMS